MRILHHQRAISAGSSAGIALATVLMLAACAPVSRPDTTTMAPYITPGYVTIGSHTMHFVEGGTVGKPLLVLIHGTPGSWHAFEALLRDAALRENFHLLAVDRPGFGRSADSGPIPSFAAQAAAVRAVFDRKRNACGAVLAGHSLGGSIAYRAATDYPDAVAGLMIISSASDPGRSKPRWYNRLAALPGASLVLPRDLEHANVEMLSLHDELQSIQAPLARLTLPVTILQGELDKLVNTQNANHAQRLMQNSTVRLRRFPDRGHFVLWQEHDAVVAELLALGQTVEQSGCPCVERSYTCRTANQRAVGGPVADRVTKTQ